jgi:hypothetical protein
LRLGGHVMPSLRGGREANDAKLSQTADNPGPNHAGSLEAGRLAVENSLVLTHATHDNQLRFGVRMIRFIMPCMGTCCEVRSACM